MADAFMRRVKEITISTHGSEYVLDEADIKTVPRPGGDGFDIILHGHITAVRAADSSTPKAPSDLDALTRDIDAGPWLTLRAMADVLEEQGADGLAAGYRWLADNKCFPDATSGYPSPARFVWREQGDPECSRLARLPGEVFRELYEDEFPQEFVSIAQAFGSAAFQLGLWLARQEAAKK